MKCYQNIERLTNFPSFWKTLGYSIIMHDIGKSATGFQEMLRHPGNNSYFWRYRHEILSAGFIELLDVSEIEKKAIVLTVLTHHKDIKTLRHKYRTVGNPLGSKRFLQKKQELIPNLEKLEKILFFLSKSASRNLNFNFSINYSLLTEKPMDEWFIDTYQRYLIPIINCQDRDDEIFFGELGYFLKGYMTACDHLGSSNNTSIVRFHNQLDKVFMFKNLYDFQKLSYSSSGNTLLIAPTGSGKTEAAFYWAANNQNKSNGKRILYMLPYIASINAMYRRVSHALTGKDVGLPYVSLGHYRAKYFLYKFYSNEDYRRVGEKEAKIKSRIAMDLARKIYSPLRIITPFQILKYLYNIKGFEQRLAELANSLIIVDEVHAYDPHNAALLTETIRFLSKRFGASLFIMSATIPKFLRKILTRELSINNHIMADDILLDQSRHRIEIVEGTVLDNLDLIIEDIKKERRVLVVVNTVQSAKDVFSEICKECDSRVLLHSQFILKDRAQIELNLDNVQVLVGTQAVEVSLDVSFDVLYTEPAPIDALLQRFGRVNRKGLQQEPAKVIVFTRGSKYDHFIYDVNMTDDTITKLKNIEILSNRKAQELVDIIYKRGFPKNGEKIFENIKTLFREQISEMKPLMVESEGEEFYELFDSIEVIPQKFVNELGLDFFSDPMMITEYSLTISNRKFQNYLGSGKILFGQIKNHPIIDVPYDRSLGLLE